MKTFKYASLLTVPALLLAGNGMDSARAQGSPERSARTEPGSGDLLSLDLDQLTKVKIVSVSKKEESLWGVASAAYVMSGEEVIRSGAKSLPEALRYVPGLNVARIDTGSWAVSARGLNDQFANKLLVMIDGRTIYTPLFSGVFWDSQDVLLQDIDRIEVIRGPGATVWGANAVNGVINVVTKSARDTQGALLYGGGGTERSVTTGGRYGAALSENTFVSVYGKYDDQTSSEPLPGLTAKDDWNMVRGGGRLDWDPASGPGKLMLQAGGYDGRITTGAGTVKDLNGSHLLGRWVQDFSADSRLSLQAYFDRYERNAGRDLTESRDTVDVELQHDLPLGERNDLSWGLGFRNTTVDLGGTVGIWTISNPSYDRNLFSGFVQDQFHVVPDKLTFTFGTKIEHNDFTQWEVQPSGRLAWTPQANQTVWMAVSRAVRTPSELEGERFADWTISRPGANPRIDLVGNPDVKSEVLTAFELGYRIQPNKHLSFDTALFYNLYDGLIETLSARTTITPLPPPPKIFIEQSFQNLFDAETYGGEIVATLSPVDYWRLTAGYSFVEAHVTGASPGARLLTTEKSSPVHSATLRSSLDLGREWKLDGGLRYVGEISVVPTTTLVNISDYFEADVRLAWRPKNWIEVAVTGQNLLDSQHAEFMSRGAFVPLEVARSVFATLTLRF
jgi:iron complex outermembrane receptor protein